MQKHLTSSNYRDTRTKSISSDNQFDRTSTPMSESCSLSVGIKMKSCDAYDEIGAGVHDCYEVPSP